MNSPERLTVSSTVPTPTGFYSQKLWGFIFPSLELPALLSGLGLGSLTPQVSFLVFIGHTWKWDCLFCHPPPPLPHCHHTVSCPSQLPISAPSTHLDEYFFFKSLVVRLPSSSMFWQFWLFFVLRLVEILFVAVREGEACLHIPLPWLDVSEKVSFLLMSCGKIFKL